MWYNNVVARLKLCFVFALMEIINGPLETVIGNMYGFRS